MIVEYLPHRNEARQLVTPTFIDDGGHWPSEDGTFVGWIAEPVHHHVPETIVCLTTAELEARVLALHRANPLCTPPENQELSEDGVRALAARWLAERTGAST